MSLRSRKLYVEEKYGTDIATLVQVLEGLGVLVIKALPPLAKPCYVLVDIERRRGRLNNPIDVWYEARTELNVRATLIGVVPDSNTTPIPGTYTIKPWNAVSEVLEALAQFPRAISSESMEHQTQSSLRRQTDRLIHDLSALVESSDLSSDAVRGTLKATWNQVTHRDLRPTLASLIDEVDQSSPSERLREILKRRLTTLENER